MNIKKIIKVVSLLPGFDFKDMVVWFNDSLRDFILKKSQEDLSDPDNFIVVLSAVNSEGEMLFIPVEMTRPTKDKRATVIREFSTLNTTKIIRQTDIKKAIEMFTEKNNKLELFEVLELCKID